MTRTLAARIAGAVLATGAAEAIALAGAGPAAAQSVASTALAPGQGLLHRPVRLLPGAGGRVGDRSGGQVPAAAQRCGDHQHAEPGDRLGGRNCRSACGAATFPGGRLLQRLRPEHRRRSTVVTLQLRGRRVLGRPARAARRGSCRPALLPSRAPWASSRRGTATPAVRSSEHRRWVRRWRTGSSPRVGAGSSGASGSSPGWRACSARPIRESSSSPASGVGKSTLLRRFAERATESGAQVTLLDARDVPDRRGRRPPAGRGGRRDKRGPAGDHRGHLRAAGRGRPGAARTDRPTLPADALLVIGGQHPPAAGWRTDPGWSELLVRVRL